jgi:ubiquinone/menaquinone biosynthesis C-methylase UbiE
VRRVLKKDGKLFILEHDLPAHPLLSYISSRLMNLFESKYYLDFMQTDLDQYLQTLGFRVEANTHYLGHHLRLITLSKQ